MGAIDSVPACPVAVMQSELGQRSLGCETLLLWGSGKPKKVKYILYKAEDPMQDNSEREIQSKGQFLKHLLVGLSCG